MPIFNTPVPIAPGPKAKPNPIREGDTIKALGETQAAVKSLVRFLERYRPESIWDADGKVREVLAANLGYRTPWRFPTGCPFDLLAKVNNDETEGDLISTIGAIRHTACESPRRPGNFVLDRYAMVTADVESAGIWAYFGESADFNAKLTAAETRSSCSLFSGDNANYLEASVEADKSALYGYAENTVFNYALAADHAEQSTYLRLYGQTANVYATLATEVGKSFLNLYNADAAHTIALATESTESFLRIGRDSGAEYASIQVENGESSLWFYDSGGDNLKYITGKLQLWQSSSTAAVYIELSDCSGKELRVREMEVCGGQHIRVLCSEPY